MKLNDGCYIRLIVFVLILGAVSSVHASDKSFRFVTLKYPPYITEPQAIGNSWVWDVVKAAMELRGYHVEVTIMPWARALKEAKEGSYDGLYGAFWTEERLQWFEYSVPIGHVTKGFYRHRDRKDIVFNGELTGLQGYRIGVGRGFATTDAFDRADYLQKVFVNNMLQGAKMLYAKRLDLMVASREVDVYQWRQLKKTYSDLPEVLVFMQPSLDIRPLYMAISKKAPNYQEKLRDLNLGINHLMLNGTYKYIQKKHGFVELHNEH